MNDDISRAVLYSEEEKVMRDDFFNMFNNQPLPDKEVLDNLGLFIRRQMLSRYLFMHEIYKRIINVHGVIMEFGSRWGQNLSLFMNFRGIYEPFNHNRKIIGFDTFEGFPSVHEKDGKNEFVSEGAYSVSSGYENFLEKILTYHESESPISHMKKFELVKGDAEKTIEKYLEQNTQTIVALAYFDMDIYQPTKTCLEKVISIMPRGGVIAFDELNYDKFPGETLAVQEVIGLNKLKLERLPFSPLTSFAVLD